jgi:hypothetical protein
MTDQRREDDEASAWLLARERGVPGPSVSEATAARYQRLQGLIEELPETPGDVDPGNDWQQGVFAALDGRSDAKAPGAVTPVPSGSAPERASHSAGPLPSAQRPAKGRSTASRARMLRWGSLAAIVPLAVLVALYAGRLPRQPDPQPFATLSIELVRGAEPHRSEDPSVGDRLIVRGVVEGPGELRVYDESGTERARCVEVAPDCAVGRVGSRSTLELTMLLRARGSLRPVLFAAPLSGQPGGLDADVAAATRAGISVTTHEPVRVR